jgi:uncharacterized Rossmann fold enzyme
MEFSTWEPAYEAILADFGYDRTDDEDARDALAELVEPFDHSRVDFVGECVAVAGAGPSLAAETDRAAAADIVVAASTAVDTLRSQGIDVDWMITDLDKNPETARELTEAGTPVAAHAHGDNVAAVCELVPTFDDGQVLPTTQADPAGPVENFGGFTDGDRAAFLADHFGAAELVFVGWDFDDPDVSDAKRRKLVWAERLLYWLERGRGEQFGVLDGRRTAVDVSALPL